MSARTRALLCRLAACEINGETHGAIELRRTLRDLGMDEQAIGRAVARIRASVSDEIRTQERHEP